MPDTNCRGCRELYLETVWWVRGMVANLPTCRTVTGQHDQYGQATLATLRWKEACRHASGANGKVVGQRYLQFEPKVPATSLGASTGSTRALKSSW